MNKVEQFILASNTKAFFSAFVLSAGLLGTFIGIFSTKLSVHFIELLWLFVIMAILLSILTGCLSLYFRTFKRLEKCEETQPDNDDFLINDLINSLEKDFDKKKYQEIITVGHILSKPLFTIGKYQSRLEIEKIVLKATKAQYALLHTNNAAQDKLNKYKEIEMIELIDSIGWMKIEMGNIQGVTDIKNGQNIAEQLNTDKSKFYIAKAFRHLGAIERRKSDYVEALAFNDKSIGKANEITDEQLKIEAIAAANYARTFVLT